MRLDTFAFEDAELTGAIERLAGDERLRDELSVVSARLQAAPGTERAADLIETVWR